MFTSKYTEKFSPAAASLVGDCLHLPAAGAYTKGNASNLPAAGAKILGIQVFIQREIHSICPPQAPQIFGFLAATQGETAVIYSTAADL